MNKVIGMLLLALIVSGCNQEPQAPGPDRIAGKPKGDATSLEQAAIDEAMSEPMDGSSVEAFERNMEAIKKRIGPKNSQYLSTALNHMLFYDLSLAGSKAKLYASVDGMSPAEIIDKVQN